MLASFVTTGSVTGISTPTGWSLVRTDASGSTGNDVQMLTYGRIAIAGDPGGSVVWNWTGANKSIVLFASYSGTASTLGAAFPGTSQNGQTSSATVTTAT